MGIIVSKYLALDQGTTSSRALVFDLSGRVLGQAQQEFTQYFPEDGWVEHDPEEIWQTSLSCLKKMLQEHPDVKAMGITNQRETIIIWDKETGKSVYPAIVWQDRRTASFCDEQKRQGLESHITAKTGLIIDPYFSASKIKWILDQDKGIRQRAEDGKLLCGTIDAFLLWRLTDKKSHYTDITNASRTNLFNIHSLAWDQELCDMFDVPLSLLPEVKPNIAHFGEISASVTNAQNPLPILAMAGDQHAATIGQCCFKKGMAKATYGTGCFALMNCGSKPVTSTAKLLTTIAYQIGNELHYALEGSIFNAGSIVKWMRDQMGFIQKASDTEKICLETPSTKGVTLIPAFTGLGAPHWQADARAMLTGMTRDTHKQHIVRAAMESIIYQSDDLLKAMVQDVGSPIDILRVDGGMVQNNWLCQFLADILAVTIERPQITEITAYGVAQLAALANGEYATLDDLTQNWHQEKDFLPMMEEGERENHLKLWHQELSKVKR